jgi:hypothetical protein
VGSKSTISEDGVARVGGVDTISLGGPTKLSSSPLSVVEGDMDATCARPRRGCVSAAAPSFLRFSGRTGDSSVCSKCRNDECSRYAGRGKAAVVAGGTAATRPDAFLCVLLLHRPATLGLRARAGETLEEDEGAEVEGRQGFAFPESRDVSARMTLGSKVLPLLERDGIGALPNGPAITCEVGERGLARIGGPVAPQ